MMLRAGNISVEIAAETNTATIPMIIDAFRTVSDTLQSLWWLVALLIAVIAVVKAVFGFRKRSETYTREQISILRKNGKYIPGVFVELNESKEVFRYFIYGSKWKQRLVRQFNYLYDNFYGDILRKACTHASARFRLKKTATLTEIGSVVGANLDLHTRLHQEQELFRPEYAESRYLFTIMSYHYEKNLGNIQQLLNAAGSRYFVLTGSAGNGKTNLLCSISELLIRLKEPVVFLNSRDMEGALLEFLFSAIRLPHLCRKYYQIYLTGINLLLKINRKHLFVIVDAVNENDNKKYGEQLALFCNEMLRYQQVKIIVSCRNEYYQERFRKQLVEQVSTPAFEYDLKEQAYPAAAIDHVIEAYRRHFYYGGRISPAVQTVLAQQMLLLRIFFEVNQNSSQDTLSIRKHEIFAQYIEGLKTTVGNEVGQLLDTIADAMLDCHNYDGLSLGKLVEAGLDVAFVQETADSSILISRKLIYHAETIAKTEEEVVYFVFDELRDYYLAKRILLRNIRGDQVNGDAILEEVEGLNAAQVSCTEGITQYIYVFFKTDLVVASTGKTKELCMTLLETLSKFPEETSQFSWPRNHREEFQNLGLRVILLSNLPLKIFETEFILDCLRKHPERDSTLLFGTMWNGTCYGGMYTLDTYLEIFFQIGQTKTMERVLGGITSFRGEDDNFSVEDFVTEHIRLAQDFPEKALQIQKVAELFMLFFEMKNPAVQEKLETYFYSLSTYEAIRAELIVQLRKASKLEGEV